MDTIVTTSPTEAAKFIRRGGTVAFPTETVYGLGANVFDEVAVSKIFNAKKRPADNPLIAHIGRLDQVNTLAAEVPVFAQRLIDAFFPGPLTVVLRKSEKVPMIATAGLDTIGVRMPRNELAREFLLASGTPVVAPSANLSGRPSPTTWQAVYEDLNGRIDCILQGEATEIGLESTVVDCSGESPVVLRQGAIALDQIRAEVHNAVLAESSDGESPKSPGMKYRHYSPTAKVKIIEAGNGILDPLTSAYIGIVDPEITLGMKLIVPDIQAYAHSVFEFFRECDRKSIGTIYCEKVMDEGIGAALMDRLRRAAHD